MRIDRASWIEPVRPSGTGAAGVLPMTDEELAAAKKREDEGRPPLGFSAPRALPRRKRKPKP